MERSTIYHDPPRMPNHGSCRRWQREIAGIRYSFNAVTMPDGERRYFARKLTGPDPRFTCYWTLVLSWVIPAA